MSDTVYLLAKREVNAQPLGHRLKGPAGSIFAIPKRAAESFLGGTMSSTGGSHGDFEVLDEQTARELLAAQEARRREYAATIAAETAAREQAEAAERARQERSQALLDLALSAVPIPDGLS